MGQIINILMLSSNLVSGSTHQRLFSVFFVVVVIVFQRAVCFEGNQLLGDDIDAFLDMIDMDMYHNDKEFQLNFDYLI